MSRSPEEFVKGFNDRTRESAFKGVHGQSKDEWIAEHQKRQLSTLSAAKKEWRKVADVALAADNRRRAEYEMRAGAALVAMSSNRARARSDDE